MSSMSSFSIASSAASVSMKRKSGRGDKESQQCGAVRVRGMFRRVWRPRYLEIDQDGVLRYYEAAVPDPNISAAARTRDIRNEMEAFSLPDLKHHDKESRPKRTVEKGKDLQSAETGTNAVEMDSRSSDEYDAVHVSRNNLDMELEEHGDNANDHVIVNTPPLSKDNITKSLSKDSMGAISKGSWDDINITPSTKKASDKNIEVMLKSKSEKEMDTVILQREKSEDIMALAKSAPTETPLHQVHDHRPKAVMTILSARLIDATSLRDVHVGLPKGTCGFVFSGRQIFSEEDGNGGQNYGSSYDDSNSSYSHFVMGETASLTGDHFEIRDDICHPLSILSANDQYFDISRDYLCSVDTKEEAQKWVKALKWAANVAKRKTSERTAGTKSKIHSVSTKGGDISIRGSFDDAVCSPIVSPVRRSRDVMTNCCDDLSFEEDNSDPKYLMDSLLSDSGIDVTNLSSQEGFTLVTKVRKFQVKNTGRKRLVGMEACMGYDIHLLLLSGNHMIHRSRKRKTNANSDDATCWDIEEKIVFRTFDEIVQLLEILAKKENSGLQTMLKSIKGSQHTNVLSASKMDSEVGKTLKNVDAAVREITSNPCLCDTSTVKKFLGILGEGTSSVKSDTVRVDEGKSIDEFVKKWLFAPVDDMKPIEKAKIYVMLMLSNSIIEAFASVFIALSARKVLQSIWSNPPILSFRIDSLLFLLGISAYVGFSFGSSKSLPLNEKQNRVSTPSKRRKARSIITENKRSIVIDNDHIEDDVAFDNESHSDESQTLTSPLPMLSDNERQSCWTRPDHNIFVVRSKTYLRNKIKLPSAPCPFKCRGTDMWLTDNPERNISRLPCVLGGKLGEENTLLVNFLLPFGNFVTYFTIPDELPENVADIWNKFKNGDQRYRDARLKLLPVVIEGPWIVKKAVGPGTAPALLSQSIPLQYYFTPETDQKKGIYEIDVIITASRIAKGILNVVKSHTDRLTIALGFIIEATTEQELPEIVLGSCQLHSLNLELCPQLPKYFLDESAVDDSFDDD